jgi:hypothetical protein
MELNIYNYHLTKQSNGKQGLKMNTKEKVSEWDKILDEYEKGIGLGTYRDDSFT